ncbi:MAG: hypothetical protein U0694_17485 [Anaerolineae bacterium]
MTVKTEWDGPDKRVMRWILEGAWTWEDFAVMHRSSTTDIAAQQHAVDIILDLSSSSLPSENTQNVLDMLPENVGVTVLVGTHVTVRSFYTALRQMHPLPANMALVTTLAEAYELVAECPDTGKLPAIR